MGDLVVIEKEGSNSVVFKLYVSQNILFYGVFGWSEKFNVEIVIICNVILWINEFDGKIENVDIML